MDVFGRRLGAWLVLAFLTYSILGTARNLLGQQTGQTSYSVGQNVAGVVFVVLALWLFVEVWSNGPRQILATKVNIAATAFYYFAIFAHYLRISATEAAVSIAMLGAITLAVWSLVFLYLSQSNHAAKG